MDAEYNSLPEDEAKAVVKRPVDQNIIACKWIYKLKEETNGWKGNSTMQMKAGRSCVFPSRSGRLLWIICTRCCKFPSAWMLWSVAVLEYLHLQETDGITAFLHGYLDEQAFAELPLVYE